MNGTETRIGKRIAADGLAGVSVALVLIPQSLAYAELAGLPAYLGLYAAALVPIAAALLASSPYLQTGPTAMTSLLTVAAIGEATANGSQDPVALAALLALLVGVVRMLLGMFRAGPLTYFLSPPVLQGFTFGAAVLILLSQVPVVLGVGTGRSGIIVNAARAMQAPGLWRLESLLLAAVSIAIIWLGRKWHAVFPGVLVAAMAGILYAHFGGYAGSTIGPIPEGFVSFRLDLPWTAWPSVLLPALVIALVGFAEPTAIARTLAAADRTRWNADREFLSQGAANIVSGLSGGFPVGGSFSRSALNRLSGARTRWSGAVTGAVVLAVLPFASFLSPLPKPVLGAVIIASVATLFQPMPLLRMWRASPRQAAVAWTTLFLTLVLSPRIEQAVLIGTGLAIGVHIWQEMRIPAEVRRSGSHLIIAPKGVLWFASAEQLEARFLDELARHPAATHLIVDLGGLGRIDFTGAQVLEEIGRRAAEAGMGMELVNAPPQSLPVLRKVCARFLPPEA